MIIPLYSSCTATILLSVCSWFISLFGLLRSAIVDESEKEVSVSERREFF
eukprot:TRINITY_DN3258_c0_g1_i2.p2 TRINITY_DN3258_c0_g1~~TRINITY_DN3258_c0_g1_i2.p2  ORF type:complete len:50 (-),score=7.22 TRINITY_DN3258_c0_g1_i2:70-219(-)